MTTATIDKPRVRPLWEIKGDELIVNFHEGQMAAWDSKKRIVAVLSGTQAGKTSYGPWHMLREVERNGPGDYLAVTATFPLLKLKMLPEFLSLFQHRLHLGEWRAVDRVFVFDQDACKVRFGWDEAARVIFGSATNSESLESATAKSAWLDEAGQDQFRLESWEAVQRRLSLHQGRVLITTTLYNLGWMKQQIYDPWRDGTATDIDVIQFPSITNPAFPPEEFERMRNALPDWKFKLFYEGLYARPAGLIYSDFVDLYREDGGHKVRPFLIPPEWPRYVGIDFGAVNTALVWLVRDPEANVLYIYRESLDGDKTTPEHVSTAKHAANGLNVISWWGGSKSERQPRMDWKASGIVVNEPPISDVEAGIDRVIALFKTMRLYVFDSCRGILDELGTYSRELGSDGQPTEKIRDKETYHRLDATRYVIAGIERGRRIPFAKRSDLDA